MAITLQDLATQLDALTDLSIFKPGEGPQRRIDDWPANAVNPPELPAGQRRNDAVVGHPECYLSWAPEAKPEERASTLGPYALADPRSPTDEARDTRATDRHVSDPVPSPGTSDQLSLRHGSRRPVPTGVTLCDPDSRTAWMPSSAPSWPNLTSISHAPPDKNSTCAGFSQSKYRFHLRPTSSDASPLLDSRTGCKWGVGIPWSTDSQSSREAVTTQPRKKRSLG